MLVLLVVLLLPVQEQPWNLNKKGIALDGYDPVSYFEGPPKKGDPSISFVFRGAIFYFSSEANRKNFTENPERYQPQYGGYCAYAMGATGEKVEVDPETYKLLNGKLYLFYNAWGNNTLKSWNANEAPLKEQADKNWQKFTYSDQ